MDVVDTHKHLLKVVSANFLFEGARVCDIVKHFTAGDHLLDDVGDFNGRAVPLMHSCTLLEIIVLDNVFMCHLSGGLNFLLNKPKLPLVELIVVMAEDLEGALGAVLCCTDLDLG